MLEQISLDLEWQQVWEEMHEEEGAIEMEEAVEVVEIPVAPDHSV
jgi:hypothetical protein